MTSTIVLLSGGQDSTLCLHLVLKNTPADEVLTLSFDYDQRHWVELDRARRIAELAGVRHHVIRMDLGVPSELTTGEPPPQTSVGLPATFVPGRNLVFLAHAFALAGGFGAKRVVFGANAIDYSGYPDCRPAFVAAMAAAGSAALDAPIELQTPLILLSKREIARLSVDVVPHNAQVLTWSCYDPRLLNLDGDRAHAIPCRRCAACVLRAKGFAEAGLEDPALSAVRE